MTNIKKIGLTALAGSLIATSAFAGSMSVSGSAGINWENYSTGSLGVNDTSDAATGTKSFSMGNQITFSGSGELDNGLNVSLSFVLDQNDDSTAAGAAYSGGPFDGHSVTVSSDSFGSLVYYGEGGDSAQNAVGDTVAGNIWDLFDERNGASSKLKESNGGTNFTYTLPEMVDGLAVAASYQPAGSSDESDTAYSLTYTGVEGLTVSYGHGSSDGQAKGSTVVNSDTTSIKASYAIGSCTVAYSDHEYDSVTNTLDQDAQAWKVSYTVSDAISVSYAQETIEKPSSTDAEYTRLTASHTSGGMTISASLAEMDNGTHTTAVAGDDEYASLSVSFAF
jgi:outer membrane protein OmpU